MIKEECSEQLRSFYESQERYCCWIKMSNKTVKLRHCSVSECRHSQKTFHSLPKDQRNAWMKFSFNDVRERLKCFCLFFTFHKVLLTLNSPQKHSMYKHLKRHFMTPLKSISMQNSTEDIVSFIFMVNDNGITLLISVSSRPLLETSYCHAETILKGTLDTHFPQVGMILKGLHEMSARYFG